MVGRLRISASNMQEAVEAFAAVSKRNELDNPMVQRLPFEIASVE